MRANSWLYHYYSMQGKLQYSLAYEAHPRMSSYYQQMLAYQHPHQEAGLYQSYLHSQLTAHPEAAHHLAQAMPAAHMAPQYAFPAAAYHHYPALETAQWERYDPAGYLAHPMLDARLDVPAPAAAERRPPTPPLSPRRKLCAPTVVPPTSGSPHRECAPVPVKRRLMAYQQSESAHGGGWNERTPPRPPPQRVPGQYSFSAHAGGGGGIGGGGALGGGGLGGGGGGGGGSDVLVARRSPPVRLHGPLKGSVSGPELEQETLSWTLSPPWSAGTPDSSQRVPDLTAAPQTAVSPPRPAESTGPELQRPVLSGWADVCSLDDLSQTSSGGGWGAARPGSAAAASRPGSVSAPCSSPDGSEEDSQHRQHQARAWCQL